MRRKADYPHRASDLPLAPGDLGLVQAFVNTADLEHGSDAIATPEALAAWLSAHKLLGADVELGREDVDDAAAAREALRAFAAANTRRQAPSEALQRLDRLAASAPAVVRFAPDGATRFEPGASNLAGALGRLFAAVAVARVEGLWPRLKVCAADGCRAAFYDTSKNLAGKWCSQRRCGNRAAGLRSQRRSRRRAARLHKQLMRKRRSHGSAAKVEDIHE